MKTYLSKIMSGEGLSRQESEDAFNLIMSGEATPAQIGAFIATLRMKGESVDEIAGGAAAMRQHAVHVDASGLDVLDTCGTGGDNCDTFNVSTAAAFVSAGAGIHVAKHGNRAISSRCGSADVLMALGANLEITPEQVCTCLREVGIGFMFAPHHHPAMKYAMGPRKELGVRTIFNMLGPLTNPAGARCQVIGVFAPDLTETFASVLRQLGSRRALVVHGHDGMDEITVTSITRISELRDENISTYEFDPRFLTGEFVDAATLRGGDAAENAAVVRAVLDGEEGPRRNIVAVNATAAILASDRVPEWQDAWAMAQESITSGAARAKLDAFIETTNRLAG